MRTMRPQMPTGDQKQTPQVPGGVHSSGKRSGSGSTKDAIERLNQEHANKGDLGDWDCGMD